MNDPNKRIDVNLSSLLSLKAELLRKHEEVTKAKSSHIVDNFVPRRGDKHKERKAKSNDSATTTTQRQHSESYEDTEMLSRSKKILEAKSKFYDKMSAAGGSLNSDENCLVMFNQKKQSGVPNARYESSSSDDSETESHDKEESGEWVEYTDCLGRTRKCLKEDVEFFKKKDGELAETVAERNKANGVDVKAEPPKWIIDTKGDFKLPMQLNDTGSKDDDTMSMLSKSSKIDEIRQNWEKQEAENLTKDSVHYQGVLFDEARTHGVGYYAFSTDEAQRASQQKELEATRLKTLASQKERENQRLSREKIIAERVKAAKNRQRARLGLPPLEENPEPTEQELVDKEAEEKRKRKEEKAKRKKEQEEKLKDNERKKHIRPWDKDKSGVRKSHPSDDDSDDDDDEEWAYKPEREPMSQEQWNEQQRSKRNMEFAPMPGTQTATRHSNPFNRPSYTAAAFEECENKTLNFTTKKRKPFVVRPVDEPSSAGTPINNELIDNYIASRRGAEIAPPANLDDSGTFTKKPKRNEPSIESSIEAGLKFLREQSDKGTLSTKMKWTSNADY
ncbi:hypothetical protein HA402_009779 [Bradysia odoriphaga]|nr:hypothetical protein HA402_009779 [Bradysia odoriphaga]